jgi:hypothetical protein
MTEPIGKVGDSQITAAARINMPSDVAGGGQQLGTILSTLAQEFGSYSSPEQIAVLLASIRLVVGAGLPAVDVADSMYSNPVCQVGDIHARMYPVTAVGSPLLDALRDGNPEWAKQAVISQVSEALPSLCPHTQHAAFLAVFCRRSATVPAPRWSGRRE